MNGPLPGVSTRPEKLAETVEIISLSKSQAPELTKSLDAAVQESRSRALDSGHAGLVVAS